MRQITATVEACIMQTSEDHTHQAYALLDLPAVDKISEAQVRGKSCVWCAGTLTAAIAVDLGPRRKPVLDREYDWFPRACKVCAGAYALLALHSHAPRCEPCVINAADCEVGMVLLRLIRDGGRSVQLDERMARLATDVITCEPCMQARIFGGEHRCTNVAGSGDRVCPCCGTAS